MRLTKGILKRIEDVSGISSSYLSRYANVSVRPRSDRAEYLDQVTSDLGFRVPKELWVFGSKEEIKIALMKGERTSS